MDEESMRKITLGTTYYNNPEYLSKFVKRNLEFCDELIIVDDGSPIGARPYINRHRKIKLYKCIKDYGFNSHGCRNLIMKKASNDWCILIDVDREFVDPKYAFDQFKDRRLIDNCLYKFAAFTRPDQSDVHVSVNDFLINKNHFWAAGGYDEEIIGVRMGDREYFDQLDHFGSRQCLVDIELRLTRRPSSSIKEAKSPLDKKASKRSLKLIEQRIKKPDPNKPTLTFEWERVW